MFLHIGLLDGSNSNDIFLIFTPICGEMIQFQDIIFLKWVGEKPPTRLAGPFGETFHPKLAPSASRRLQTAALDLLAPTLYSHEEYGMATKVRQGNSRDFKATKEMVKKPPVFMRKAQENFTACFW